MVADAAAAHGGRGSVRSGPTGPRVCDSASRFGAWRPITRSERRRSPLWLFRRQPPPHRFPLVPVIDPERPIGDILVADGVLTSEQLAKALRVVPRARVEEARRAGRKTLSVGASLHPDPETRLLGRPAFHLLGLDDVRVAAMLVDLEDEREQLSAIF